MLNKYISHALGGYQNLTYTNSKEALEFNYEEQQHRYFEFDVSETSDGKYVLIHDWEETWKRHFNQTGIPTYQEFMSSKMLSNLTPLDLDYLMNWLTNTTDAYLVSDVKHNNLPVLKYIAENFPNLKSRIIPQIYQYNDYDKVTALGFNNIIMALYHIAIHPKEVLDFAKDYPVTAIAMSKSDAIKYDIAKELNVIGTKTYVHTVNDLAEVKILTERYQIAGFFTDFLK